jgi:SNF2 family DNA or RNA helicase
MTAVLEEGLQPRYKLHPFQEEMVAKACKVPVFLCGDDMGLGKTIEGMEVDRRRRVADGRTGLKTLVITTLSGTDVWTQHYLTYLPQLRTTVIDPKNRHVFIRRLQQGIADVYILHWDILRMPEMLDALRAVPWFHIVADEIHRAKNRKAQVTQAFKKIPSKYRLGMSGTPGDNKPDDMWSPLNWILPRQFSSYWKFFKYYCDYKKHPDGYRIVVGVRNVQHMHKIIDPYWIRRRKEQVAKDLPPKVYDTRWVELNPTQRRAYEDMRKKQLAWVGENEDQPIAAPVVITQLMRLQQFAVSGIVVEAGTKRKRNKYYDPTRPRIAEDDVRDWGQVVNGKYEGDNWYVRTVPTTIYKMVDPSAKLDYFMDMIKDVDLNENPVVVFTQFKRAATLLSERLTKAKIAHGVVTGDVAKGDRDKAVLAFQSGRTQVFIGTIGSCRESITLTRSQTVVFVDRAWSPSWNRQAEDRLHRLGQTGSVQVIDLVARNTLDLGRMQQYQLKWTWLQTMFGDATYDYQKTLDKEPALPGTSSS